MLLFILISTAAASAAVWVATRKFHSILSSGIYMMNTIVGTIMGTLMAVVLCIDETDAIQSSLPYEVDILGLFHRQSG